MKNNDLRYIFSLLFVVLLFACSTKKDKWVNRKWQALNTEYNVLYNGNIALDKGIEDVKLTYTDNFWEILPVERMQVSAENILPGQNRNANFARAEEKATKAIQKRSMNIDGKEKNPQMDEAHLLLGKARYYDQRYVPALEAFNYILYKYPESDKIYEAKIWRERTNMRMDNDALAVKNLKKLLIDIKLKTKLKQQVYADVNATLAQAFLNMEERDSARARLKDARELTKSKEEKARYTFILGQLYDEAGEKDSAYAAFQTIIDMKRNSPRRYIIQAHARQAAQFDFAKGDTIAFLKKYKKLMDDRENRPFLDVLNHQMALFYDKKTNRKQAVKYYNKSLRTKSQDQYLMASNYRNLAKIYFDNAKYQQAGQYYDSTLTRLMPKTREYRYIKNKRENLADVIKYEGIAQHHDSILNVVSLSPADRKSFYEDYIVRLKKSDAEKAAAEKAAQEKAERLARNASSNDDVIDPVNSKRSPGLPSAPGSGVQGKTNDKLNEKTLANKGGSDITKTTAGKNDAFYFYNPSTVAYGKLEFKKKWGSRGLKDNWRISSSKESDSDKKNDASNSKDSLSGDAKKDKIDERYTADFYLKQLPEDKKLLDSLAKERNFAYYQLGIIYKEKFKEYQLAASKLEQLLLNKPEERLVLPSMYHLFKIYEIIDKPKAEAMKNKIISQYPESRYAQILKNGTTDPNSAALSPELAYKNLYKMYDDGQFIQTLEGLEKATEQFTGEEIVPKMELLKAAVIGKLKGLAEYRKALNYVALNYPNVEEGKQAEAMIAKDIPALEQLQFDAAEPLSWKIIYKVSNVETPATKAVEDKLKKFASERTTEKLTLSQDVYTMTENFIVIHGIGTEQKANDIATILRDYKDYNIPLKAIVISNENYKIVQIKKNLEEYLKPGPRAQGPTPISQDKNKPAEKAGQSQANPPTSQKGVPPAPGSMPPSGDDAQKKQQLLEQQIREAEQKRRDLDEKTKKQEPPQPVDVNSDDPEDSPNPPAPPVKGK
ncbi:type IX secretion system periplasmic lipoprotein PorW/SprE [Flavobacterium pallidum]|uniref:type IX secretion system periplasmic lipoprotein PorW/SprE n=1 Tax=Flavobacterium pallidum TaxID=2172098 RepID=UPI001FE36BB8|nr:gliding motility protein [Flavobacterium pallidum]